MKFRRRGITQNKLRYTHNTSPFKIQYGRKGSENLTSLLATFVKFVGLSASIFLHYADAIEVRVTVVCCDVT